MSGERAQRRLILFMVPDPLQLELVSTTAYADGPIIHTYAS